MLIFLMYRHINEHLNESPFSFEQICFFKILHFTVVFLFYQNDVRLFSKHTFSRSIFRTVTCNKVIKERRCSCLFVLDLDVGTVLLSGSEKSEHFFFLSPSHALLR